MPNIFSKIFRRKNLDGEKDALVEQNVNGGRNGGKRKKIRRPSSPRRNRRENASAPVSSNTAIDIVGTATKNQVSPLSPQNSSSPKGFKNSTSSSIHHHNKNGNRPGYEIAPSTGSTSKTSDRDSPVPFDEAADPRMSPKSGRTMQGNQRPVLSPHNTSSSPPSRISSGPVDLDDENVSDEEENILRRDTISAIPNFGMDGMGGPSNLPRTLLNKTPADIHDDGESLNFSTDADDDTEYLNAKRGVVTPSLDQSVASTYRSDADASIFPNLIDDKDSLTDEKVLPSAWDPNSPILNDFPTTSTTNTSSTGNVSGFPSPPPQPNSAVSLLKQRTRQKPSTATSTASGSTASHPFQDDFAFEADFSSFQSDWPSANDSSPAKKSTTPTSNTTKESISPSKKHSMVYIETGKLDTKNKTPDDNPPTTASRSLAAHETSLEELLEKAKSKVPKKSTHSVSSAPVKPSFIRDGSRYHSSRSSAGGSAAAASASDIIKNLDAAHKSRESGSIKSAKERLKKRRQHKESDESDEAGESWLFDEVTGVLGARGIAADLESLSGRSHQSGGNRSHKSHRSTKSKRKSRRSSGESVNSKDSKRSNNSRRSRSSRYSHRSTKSYISQMSEQSRSVANDLLRLEMQLAMVGQQQSLSQSSVGGNEDRSKSSLGPDGGHRSTRSKASASSRRTATSSAARRSRITVMAPPGKLGIILANKADSKGTVVSGVRTSSVLAEKISPGDRIVAIDGEDVSLMTVSEITTIMARKADFERTLTVLTTPRTTSNVIAPSSSNAEGSQQDGKKYRS